MGRRRIAILCAPLLGGALLSLAPAALAAPLPAVRPPVAPALVATPLATPTTAQLALPLPPDLQTQALAPPSAPSSAQARQAVIGTMAEMLKPDADAVLGGVAATLA